MLLRIHFLQQWFSLSDEGVEDALLVVQVYRAFAGIDLGATRMPDATTVLRVQRSTAHGLATGFLATINAVLDAKGLVLRRATAVDATIARAPNSTTNRTGTRDPEMHHTRKGNQWFSLMKAHIWTDVASGLVHTVVGTPANTHDLTVAGHLLHGGRRTSTRMRAPRGR
jgi:transposase, IS5 family